MFGSWSGGEAGKTTADDADAGGGADTGGCRYVEYRQSVVEQRRGVIPHLHKEVWGGWTEDNLSGIQLRGSQYLSDRVKIDCGAPLYRLANVDIFHTEHAEGAITHIAQRRDQFFWIRHKHRLKLLASAQAHINGDEPRPSRSPSSGSCPKCDPILSSCPWYHHTSNTAIIISIAFPVGNIMMHCVQWYERRVPPAELIDVDGADHCECLNGVDVGRVAAFDRLLSDFIDGTDEFRDGALKIIPRVAVGGWVVRNGVGKVPAILGRKVKQTYYRNSDANYIEIDADLSDSRIAGRIVGLVKSYCKSIVVELSFLFQGDSDQTLPESLIGGIRIDRADMDKTPHFKVKRRPQADPDTVTDSDTEKQDDREHGENGDEPPSRRGDDD